MQFTSVSINGTLFDCAGNADTQEDNFGGIEARFTLSQHGEQVARMVRYFTGGYAVIFSNGVRLQFGADSVIFGQLTTLPKRKCIEV